MSDIHRTIENHRIHLALILAIFLHLLFLLLYNPVGQLLMLAGDPLSVRAEPPPIAFEFVEVPNQENAPAPPPDASFLADRNSRAQDAAAADTDSPLPISEGVSTTSRDREYSTGSSVRAGPPGAEPTQGERRSDPVDPLEEGAALSRMSEEGESGESTRESIYGTPAVPPRAVRMDNRESSARELGDFQLSTYAWDFAPYMSYLKRRIEGNISPPPAFTHYGLIHGKTWVRFKILRDGRLEDLEVLKHEGSDGSHLLEDTSVRAVMNSADFKPLPDHFPDEYLEISGLFEYTVFRPDRQ